MQLSTRTLSYGVACLVLFLSLPLQARIQYVTLETEGTGVSAQAAINDALIIAISQIKGTEISSRTNLSSLEVGNGNDSKSLEIYQQTINKRTNGLIKEYTVISKQHSSLGDGLWSATVRATISKYAVSEQVNRLRMAVLPFKINGKIPSWKNPGEFKDNLTQGLVNYLTQTRKFAILDREYTDEQNQELLTIKNGNFSIDELAKLGQRLAVDYLIVGTINTIYFDKNQKTLKNSGKVITTIRQGARISYRIIDTATGQVKLSDTFDKVIHSSSSSISVATVSSKIAHQMGVSILDSIYPIRVESVQGNYIFIGQGSKTVQKGDKYALIKLGNTLKDSYTGESLGREEKKVGIVKITSVQAKHAKAIIVQSKVDLVKQFKPGLFILRQEITQKSTDVSFKQNEETVKKSMSSFEKSLSNDW